MNTNTKLHVAYFLAPLLALGLLRPAASSCQEETTIVFAPIELTGYGGSALADRILDMLIENVIRTYPQLKVLERSALGRVFRELRFTFTYDNTSRASDVGNLLGADFIVIIKMNPSYRTSSAMMTNVVTGNQMYNFEGAVNATIKIVSLKDGSIRDLYTTPSMAQFLGQGDNEQRIGWGFETKTLSDCLIELFVQQTQSWFMNLPHKVLW